MLVLYLKKNFNIKENYSVQYLHSEFIFLVMCLQQNYEMSRDNNYCLNPLSSGPFPLLDYTLRYLHTHSLITFANEVKIQTTLP